MNEIRTTDASKPHRLARKLYMERGRHGLSQFDLAKLSGVSRSSIVYIETGRVERPQADTLAKINKALGGALDNWL